MTGQFGRDDCEILERTDLYRGYFRAEKLIFRHRKFAGGWSEVYGREVFVSKGAASILLYDPAMDTVVLVEQFRAGAMVGPQSPWQLEVVAGMLDKSLPPDEIARREAVEEAGCEVQEMVKIGGFYTTPGICNEFVHLYAAKVDASKLAAIAGLPEEHEDIRVHVVKRQQAFDWLDQGRIENMITAVSLQWLRIHGTDW